MTPSANLTIEKELPISSISGAEDQYLRTPSSEFQNPKPTKLVSKKLLGHPNASTRCPNTNSFSSKRTAVARSTHFLVPKNLL
jgi:hypothetical protein